MLVPVSATTGATARRCYCAVCDVDICEKCHVQLNETETPLHHRVHVCQEEDVLAVRTMLRTTRPCPQCASRIERAAGCSQMWCTKCHCAFDWNTGRIIDQRREMLHNPHLHDYLNNVYRARYEPVDGRAAGDGDDGGGDAELFGPDNYEPTDCGAPPHVNTFYQYSRLRTNRRRRDNKLDLNLRVIGAYLRSVYHIADTLERQFLYVYPAMHWDEDKRFVANLDIRFKFLTGAIDRSRYEKSLYQRHLKLLHAKQVRDVCRLVVGVSGDILHRLFGAPLDCDVEPYTDEIRGLFTHARGLIVGISAHYGQGNKLARRIRDDVECNLREPPPSRVYV